MRLREIAQRIALPERVVRYAFDHRLPGGNPGKVQPDLAGQPISFTDLESMGLAVAAILLDGGLKRQAIVQCMAFLCDARWLQGEDLPGSLRARGGYRYIPLQLIGTGRTAEKATVWLGDGNHCRMQIDDFDSGWRAAPNWIRLDPTYRPRVTTELDLGRVSDEIHRPSSSGR